MSSTLTGPEHSAEAFYRRYGALIHGILAAISIGVTWYISTTVSSAEIKSQLQTNTAKIAEQDKKIENLTAALDRVLTKEVYDVGRKADSAQAERMERMLLQIINSNK